MDENKKSIINAEYLKILEKLKDSNLFGEKIDLNDPEMVAVGTYFLATMESGHFKHIFKESDKIAKTQ